MPIVFGKESRFTAFRLCGHAPAFFRFIEVTLDPRTHAISPSFEHNIKGFPKLRQDCTQIYEMVNDNLRARG